MLVLLLFSFTLVAATVIPSWSLGCALGALALLVWALLVWHAGRGFAMARALRLWLLLLVPYAVILWALSHAGAKPSEALQFGAQTLVTGAAFLWLGASFDPLVVLTKLSRTILPGWLTIVFFVQWRLVGTLLDEGRTAMLATQLRLPGRTWRVRRMQASLLLQKMVRVAWAHADTIATTIDARGFAGRLPDVRQQRSMR